MPYKIRRVGNQYAVYQGNSGRRMGTHATKKAARDQIAAIGANTKKTAKKTAKKKS